MKKQGSLIIAINRKAYHDYDIIDTLEAGIVLTGLEIKSVRGHRVVLAGSYAKLIHGELFWVGGDISGQRTRKLLISKRQLHHLTGKIDGSLTFIPLNIYLKRGYAKIELGLGKRKKLWDKREQIKKRDRAREIRL